MKKTKRSLFTSLVTLLLCSAMFAGSTFAWFTDTVSNTGNKIQAGTLDVELWQKTETLSSDQTADTQHVKAITEEGYEEYSNISDSTVAVFNYDKWEPGYSTPTGFAIKNKGNLALKYELTFYLIDSKTGLEQLEVDKSSLTPEQYADKLAHLSKEKVNANSKLEEAIEVYQGETKLGTLKDFFDGRQSFTGHLSAGKVFKTSDLKLIMPTDKGNKYENASISFDIRVLATQYTEEKDGFGSNQYDALADETPDHADWERFKTLASDTKTIKDNEDTVFKTNNNIAEDKQGYTEVTVPKEVVAFVPGKDTTMEVETTPILAANNLFTVTTTGEGSVGAIDLTVTVDGIQVNQFKNEAENPVPVKVVTYVAKNMTNVSLSYNDETWTSVATEDEVTTGKFFYNKDTGRFVYGTTHFSTFVIGADEVAYVEDSNTAYKTLGEAIDAAEGKEIAIIKNINTTNNGFTIASGKVAVIDLNGRKIYTDHASSGNTYVIKNQGTLTIIDSSVNKQGQISIDNGSGYRNDHVLYLEGGSTTIINGGRVVTEGYYPVYVVQATEATGKTTFIMNDGYISGGYYGLYLNGGKIGAGVALDATINGGEIITTFYENNVRMYAATQGLPPNMTFKNYVKQFDVCGYPIQTYYDTNLTVKNARLDYYGPFVTDEYINSRLAALEPNAYDVSQYGEPTEANTVIDIDIACCPVSIDEGNKNATTKIDIHNTKLGFYERDGSSIDQYEETEYNPTDFYYQELLDAWFTLTEDNGVYTFVKK